MKETPLPILPALHKIMFLYVSHRLAMLVSVMFKLEFNLNGGGTLSGA